MQIEKSEYMEMWKTGYKKMKPKSSKKKRKCMTCAEEFISTWNGNRVCKSCLNSSLWKSGPNCYTQSLTLLTVGNVKLKKNCTTPEDYLDAKYLLDEEFDN